MIEKDKDLNGQVQKSIGMIDHALRRFCSHIEAEGENNSVDISAEELTSLRAGLTDPDSLTIDKWVVIVTLLNEKAKERGLDCININDLITLLEHYHASND